MSEPARIPRMGERTAEFQHGYGRCQCGCGANVDETDATGLFVRFIKDHDAVAVSRRIGAAGGTARSVLAWHTRQTGASDDRRAKESLEPDASAGDFGARIAVGRNTSRRARELGRRETDRLVDMFADQTFARQQLEVKLGILESEVEFAIKYVKAFCRDDHSTGDALIARLEAALQAVRQDNTGAARRMAAANSGWGPLESR